MTPQEFADELTKAAAAHQSLGAFFDKLEQKADAAFHYGLSAGYGNAAKAAPLITAPK